jgi:hypothetical protein
MQDGDEHGGQGSEKQRRSEENKYISAQIEGISRKSVWTGGDERALGRQ